MDATLRPWTLEDGEALAALARDNPDLARQFGIIESEADALAVIGAWLARAASGDAMIWAISDDLDQPIGAVGVTQIERRHRTGWCWYWLANSARGFGIATRALATAAEAAFADGIFRLELAHRVNNPSSCGVAARAGFSAEGIERSRLEYGGVRYDCETHARLADDPSPMCGTLPQRS